MIKSRLWHEVLDLAMCWRFFKYKHMLKDTKTKFYSHNTYLTMSETQKDLDLKLPFELDNVLKRLDHAQADLESLLSPKSLKGHGSRETSTIGLQFHVH